MPSRYKKAHRTHALAQRAGEPYPHLGAGEAAGRSGSDARVLALFAELCERVPDAAKRAQLLRVPTELDAAWARGAKLPLLRARRRALEHALREPSAE